MPGSPFSSEELRLAKLWYNEDNVASSEIARRLRRVKSTITRAVVQELPRGGRGGCGVRVFVCVCLCVYMM